MTEEAYNKAAELLGKIYKIQETLRFFSIVKESAYPCAPYLTDGHGNTCPVPPAIEKEEFKLIKTEYCNQLEALKKEFKKL